jgi:coenzyme PQQ precursor peptide PqqA
LHAGSYAFCPIDTFVGCGARCAPSGGNLKLQNIEGKSMKRWIRPVVEELCVGMEINAYACAEL